jgi:hypothetical protein
MHTDPVDEYLLLKRDDALAFHNTVAKPVNRKKAR